MAKTELFARSQPGGLFSIVNEMAVTGEIRWFKGNAAVNGDGKSPDTPFNDLQDAIDASDDNAGDVIVVMRGAYNPTEAINVDCAGLVIRAQNFGVNPLSPEKFAIYPDASYATGPMFIVSQPCRIEGLEIVTRNVAPGADNDAMTTSGAALAIAGEGGGYAGGFVHLKNCRFVDWWGNAYGVEFGAGAYCLIEDCEFEGFDAGVYFRSTSSNNPAFNTVRNCKFIDCTNGIEHKVGATPGNFLYYGNVFIDYTDAIDFNQAGGGAGNGLVANNYYETATDAATYDCTVAQAQALGVTFSGNHYSE